MEISTKDAAGKLGVTADHIRQMCRQGKLPDARHVSGVWLVPEEAVAAELERRRLEAESTTPKPPGRPPKQPPQEV